MNVTVLQPARTPFDIANPGMPPALELSACNLNAALAQDEYLTLRDQGGRLCDRTLFEQLSDLDLACIYQSGGAHLHDAAYCELHLRQLTPWKIVSCPPLEVVP